MSANQAGGEGEGEIRWVAMGRKMGWGERGRRGGESEERGDEGERKGGERGDGREGEASYR